MKSTRKLTLEEKIRRQLELHDRLQKAREQEKPFRVFSATDDWIHIVEWKWNEMWVIYTFKFKWYWSNWLTAIFEKTAEYWMLPPPIA